MSCQPLNIEIWHRLSRSKEGISQEWAIVELQGDLQPQEDSSYEGNFIGDLHFLKSGTPVLIIENQLLYGKEVKLEKPLALIKKGKPGDIVEYDVKIIITRKLQFKTRPKPLVEE